MKFGNYKRKHHRLRGLDQIVEEILKCPEVSRVIPGVIAKTGSGTGGLRVKYETQAGLKCLYCHAGGVQEIFVICSNSKKAREFILNMPA